MTAIGDLEKSDNMGSSEGEGFVNFEKFKAMGKKRE